MIFLRELRKFCKITTKNSERLGRQARLGTEPGPSRLPTLRAVPLHYWWGVCLRDKLRHSISIFTSVVSEILLYQEIYLKTFYVYLSLTVVSVLWRISRRKDKISRPQTIVFSVKHIDLESRKLWKIIFNKYSRYEWFSYNCMFRLMCL